MQLLALGGKIGVDIYVLISGYFLITSKEVKLNKLIRMWLQLFTCSVLSFAVFSATKVEPFSFLKLLAGLFPVLSEGWWFANSYLMLYILHPYINKLLTGLDQKAYKGFLCLLLFLWCVIPTFTHLPLECNKLLWFVLVYAMAGYYRLYGSEIRWKPRKILLAALATAGLTFGTAIVFDLIGLKKPSAAENAMWFYEMASLPIIAVAVLLFMFFARLTLKNNRLINLVSSATFGVYLIHDDRYVRPFLWKSLFKSASYSESSLLIPYTVFAVVIVFVVCTIIELIRKQALERQYGGLVDRISAFLLDRWERIETRLHW